VLEIVGVCVRVCVSVCGLEFVYVCSVSNSLSLFFCECVCAWYRTRMCEALIVEERR
jgi:hypothetical protein